MNYPPHEFIGEDGRPTGFNVELLLSVCEVMGMTCEVELGPWQEVREKLERGDIDVITGMYHSGEREKKVDFSVPHSVVHHSIFVRRGSDIGGEEELSGKEVIVQRGDIMHDYLKESDIHGVKIVPVETQSEALKLLTEGEHDAALLARLQGLYLINRLELENLKAVGPPIHPRKYCFAVKKGDQELLTKLNEGLGILDANGEYRMLHDKWFGVLEARSVISTKIFKWGVVLTVLLALLLVVALYWTRALQASVKERTEELERELAEKEAAEKKVRESEKRYRGLVETMTEGLAVMDREANLTFVNQRFCDFVGYEKEEITGKHASYLLSSENKEEFEKQWERRARGQSVLYEVSFVKKNGEHLDAIVSARPIMDESGTFMGSISVVTDITEHKKLEEEVIKARKLDSVALLAGGIAHDFNNILTAILGNLSLALATGDMSEETRELVKAAESASINAKGLTQQLLTFSKGGAPIKEETTVKDFIIESVDFILRGSKVRAEFEIEEGLPRIRMDRGQINQVINNLVINAVQAMPEGGTVYVYAERADVAEDEVNGLDVGEYVKISFRDEGIGMDKDVLEHLFEPYFSTKEEGSGLGLATSYSIIKRHGGIMTVTSGPGDGSEFSLYLPVSGEASKGASPSAAKEGKLSGRVMIVDDEKSVRDTLVRMLASLGIEALGCSGPRDAVAQYQKAIDNEDRFDAVILDLTLPGTGGGVDILDSLKKIDPEVAAVVSSGYAHDPVMANYEDYGFTAVMVKPYTMDKLAEIMGKVLPDSD